MKHITLVEIYNCRCFLSSLPLREKKMFQVIMLKTNNYSVFTNFQR